MSHEKALEEAALVINRLRGDGGLAAYKIAELAIDAFLTATKPTREVGEVIELLRRCERANIEWGQIIVASGLGHAAGLIESQSREIESLGRLVDWYQAEYVKPPSLPHGEEQH